MGREQELAYLAGFFDGEGCICITRHKHRSTVSGYEWRLIIEVSNNKPQTVKRFHELFGGSLKMFSRKGQRCKHWNWYLRGNEAKRFLEIIHPYLIQKKEEAVIAIEFQVAKSRKKYRKTEAELAIEETQAILMRELKREVI